MNISEITITDLCNQWLNMKKLSVKESTYAKYQYIIKTEILPELGKYPLSRINSSVINSFTGKKLGISGENCSRKLASKTVRDIYTILKSIIRYGENEYHTGVLTANSVLPRPKLGNVEALTIQEMKILDMYLWQHQDDPRCVGLLLCMYSGMRIGEICALKWEDVDLEKRTIHIKYTMQRITNPENDIKCKTKIVIDEPKTKSSRRVIPISGEIYPAIYKLHDLANGNPYFLSKTHQYVEPRNYQYFFKSILKKAGIRNVNFHVLRHSFATQCVAVGMDIKTISELLGHSNTSITLTYYVHSSLDTKKNQLEMFKIRDCVCKDNNIGVVGVKQS